jgi:hypothetical protein
MRVGEETFDTEWRIKVAKQERALLRLQEVLEMRMRAKIHLPTSTPSPALAAPVAFDAELDDDEALVLLMWMVDVDCSGAVSEAELLRAGITTKMN